MTSTQFLPFRSTRANRLFTCAVMTAAVIATAGIAATLQPAHAALAPDDALMPPPALSVASTEPTDGARRFRGPGRDRAEGAAAERPAREPQIDKNLTNDQVKDIVEGHIAMSGNPNLKVGKITPKEDGVVSVEIVTKTGALVETREISTRTGLPAGVERRFAQMRERFRGHGGPRMSKEHGAMGHGAMAHRGGPAMGGGKGPGEAKDLALTTDQAKKLAEARLILRGNKNLKVGAVKEKDADTISIDIVAADNSLVTQELIDRHTGRPQRPSRS